MKIVNQPNNIRQVYKQEQDAAQGVEKSADKGSIAHGSESEGKLHVQKDAATLSSGALLFAKGAAALKETPEVRSELVAQLKEEINAGRYQIPYEQLAKRLSGLLNQTD